MEIGVYEYNTQTHSVQIKLQNDSAQPHSDSTQMTFTVQSKLAKRYALNSNPVSKSQNVVVRCQNRIQTDT